MLPSYKKKRRKPPGYSEGSNLSYYSSEGGEEIKKSLLKLIENPNAKLTFDSFKLSVKPGTLWTRLDQSWQYLIDRDPEGEKWKHLREAYEIKKNDRFCYIRKKPVVTSFDDAVSVEDDHRETGFSKMLDWRGTLNKYVEQMPDGAPPLELEGLRLSSDEVDGLASYLGSIDEVVATITLNSHGFKVIKNKVLAQHIKMKRGTSDQEG